MKVELNLMITHLKTPRRHLWVVLKVGQAGLDMLMWICLLGGKVMRCIWHQGEGNLSQESTLPVSFTLWHGLECQVLLREISHYCRVLKQRFPQNWRHASEGNEMLWIECSLTAVRVTPSQACTVCLMSLHHMNCGWHVEKQTSCLVHKKVSDSY